MVVDREGRYSKLSDQGKLTTDLVKGLASSNVRVLINELYDDLAMAGSDRPAQKPRHREVQHQHRLEDNERQALVEAFKAGEKIEDLAEQFGIHRSTVRAQLDRAGLQFLPYGAKLTSSDIEAASLLYLNGQSLVAVGKQFKVDAETIRRTLRQAGVRIRGPHDRR
jgi:transposase-like protein